MTRGSLGGLLVVGLVLLTACGEEENPEPVGPEFRELEADQVMVGVEHYMTRDGVRRAHLEADTAYFLSESSSVMVRHYTVDFFDPEGGLRSVLTARQGIYDMQSGDMQARGDVVVVDPDESQRLMTERLLYDASTGKLESDVDFLLLRGRDTIRGTGFVTDPGLDSLTTRQPSVVSPPEAEGPSANGPPSGPADSARADTARPPAGEAEPAAGDTATATEDTAASGADGR